MRNNLFDLITSKEETEIVTEAKQQKEIVYKIIGDLQPHGSHQVYEVDFDKKTVRNAELKHTEIVGLFTWKQDIKNEKIIHKNNCVYYSCLNIDNLLRHFKSKYNVDLSTFDIQTRFVKNGNHRKITIQDIESESKK